jgi:hypothetical protein
MSLAWSVGQSITAARLNKRLPVMATKAADLSRASTATVAADPDLVFNLKAGVSYHITGTLLVYSGSTTPKFKYSWAWTNSAAAILATHGLVTTVTLSSGSIEGWAYVNDSTSPSAEAPYSATNAVCSIQVNDFIIVGSSLDTTLTLQWSQQVSNATATTLKQGSTIACMPIG